MSQTGFALASLSLLGAAQLLGGPPWAALCAIALVALVFTDRRTSSLALIASSMTWVVLSRLTANRQLFFPFTMSLASIVFVQLCDRNFWRGVFGGVAVLAAFFVVRTQQHASARVLFIEFIVATSILGFAMIAYSVSPRHVVSRIVITIVVSLLAFFSLLI
jgi:predicted neutral ceramidase superfamily lipid hydrolase